VVYEQRLELMQAEDVSETIADMRHEVLDDLVAKHIPEKSYAEQWNGAGLAADVKRVLAIDAPVEEWLKEEGIAETEVRERLDALVEKKVAQKVANYGESMIRMAEKSLLLQILDHLWKEHLLQLDHLRQGIHLRGYGQRDPLNEYKREAFALFETMLGRLRETVTQVLAHLEIRMQPPAGGGQAGVAAAGATVPPAGGAMRQPLPPQSAQPAQPNGDGGGVATAERPRTVAAEGDWGKVPRNAPCPCGSGKKFKQCHGQIT
ncbi:MAG TPA: SEC-C metal-binding domain-containing protein, partial [Geminicoccaceae bacterium]|nr:SEC-C metal-binding domain-containing protein [Geminicoccaceae bacterium]